MFYSQPILNIVILIYKTVAMLGIEPGLHARQAPHHCTTAQLGELLNCLQLHSEVFA